MVNSISKMSKGVPLNDEDRLPWLDMLAEKIQHWHAGEGAVLACSALKEAYRQRLMSIPRQNITWIYLYGDTELIRSRLAGRKQHFFNKALLLAQYNDLEVPEYGCHINVSMAPEEVLAEILICIKDKQL
jgi:carbohydrate kinase (thermoresistant glucokinase family)